MTAAGWEAVSDGLVTSTIAVLTLALIAHAVENAARVRLATPTRSLAVTGAGSSDVADRADRPSGPGLQELAGRIGVALTVLGVALLILAVLTRGLAAQRAPWATMYEFTLTGAAAVGVAHLLMLQRSRSRSLGVWVVALLLLALGLGVTVLYSPVSGLIPVLDSAWLVVHVAAAIVAGGLFTIGFLATVVQLVRTRAGLRPAMLGALPDIAHTAHLIAFPIWTFAVLAGAIWAENAWGRYWGWDPKETWAFITWVCYAAFLHAEATAGWRGTRAAWLAVAGYAAFLFNFFGVNIWLPGLHSYAGV